ncbi:MAG: hypothetical protein AAFO04_17535 [Cyanobacteria bacterium J06592_8]
MNHKWLERENHLFRSTHLHFSGLKVEWGSQATSSINQRLRITLDKAGAISKHNRVAGMI